MRYLPLFLTACAPSVPVHMNTSIGEKLMTCYEMQNTMPDTKYAVTRYDIYDQENMVVSVTKTSTLEDMVINQSTYYTVALPAASAAVEACRQTYSVLRE